MSVFWISDEVEASVWSLWISRFDSYCATWLWIYTTCYRISRLGCRCSLGCSFALERIIFPHKQRCSSKREVLQPWSGAKSDLWQRLWSRPCLSLTSGILFTSSPISAFSGVFFCFVFCFKKAELARCPVHINNYFWLQLRVCLWS